MTISHLIRPFTASALCVVLVLQWSVQLAHVVAEHADAGQEQHCDAEGEEQHIHDSGFAHEACTFCEANFSTPIEFQLYHHWSIQIPAIGYGLLNMVPEHLLFADTPANPALRGPPSM